MATNNFKPFAVGAGANVTAQADYEALAALASGFTAGKASSAEVNKALRQSTAIASVLAQFIANATGNDVLDDGNTATVLTNLIAALKTNGALNFLQTANHFSEIKSAGTTAISAALANLGLSSLALAGVNGGLLSNNGYVTLPVMISGVKTTLIIQWGSFTGTTSASGTNGIYENSSISVTWPIAFPNVIFGVITGGASDVSGAGQQEQSWNLSKSPNVGYFGVQCRTASASMTGTYLAIGY